MSEPTLAFEKFNIRQEDGRYILEITGLDPDGVRWGGSVSAKPADSLLDVAHNLELAAKVIRKTVKRVESMRKAAEPG